MSLNLTKKVAKAALFTAALLATTLFAARANAQSVFHGKFTLQHATRWGKVVLPAGDYAITIAPSGGADAGLFLISEANSGKTIGHEACWIAEDAPKNGTDALLIVAHGNRAIVHSFQVTELGETCIYDRALTGRAGLEANNREAVPVLVSKN